MVVDENIDVDRYRIIKIKRLGELETTTYKLCSHVFMLGGGVAFKGFKVKGKYSNRVYNLVEVPEDNTARLEIGGRRSFLEEVSVESSNIIYDNNGDNYLNGRTNEVIIPNQEDAGLIKVVSLSNRNLMRFPKELLNWNYIESLDLSYNRIQRLPDEFGYSFENLKELNLSNTQIDRLPESFWKIRTLEKIKIENCPFPSSISGFSECTIDNLKDVYRSVTGKLI